MTRDELRALVARQKPELNWKCEGTYDRQARLRELVEELHAAIEAHECGPQRSKACDSPYHQDADRDCEANPTAQCYDVRALRDDGTPQKEMRKDHP